MSDESPASSETAMHGASPEAVRAAREAGEPLPGTRGFAGRLDDALVRDVLGRYPVFHERDDPTAWAFDPTVLASPTAVPAGTVVTPGGTDLVWTIPDPDPTSDPERAVADVRQAIEPSLAAVATDDLAVAFSGGIDSAILAAHLDVPLYVGGFPDSHDVAAARSAADALGRDLRVVEFTHEDVDRAAAAVARATGRTNAMDVQIALPLFLVARRAAANGFERLAVGQGADELFGGYAKVAKAPADPRVEADSIAGARREVVESLPEQLERDVLALRAAGVEPVAPLLDDRVVAAALALPGELLVTEPGEDGVRKHALREAAREWLPSAVVTRDKKAVQYGSLAARELDRLARQAGFKRRMDDHVTKYVEHLLGERPAPE